MSRPRQIPTIDEARFDEGVEFAERFFMSTSNVHAALRSWPGYSKKPAFRTRSSV